MAIDKYSDWRLDLYGDGDLIEELRNQAAELGLQNNISFMGMRKDLRNLYGEYAFFVLPSYREGMPLVLLEAKLNKLPAVCFRYFDGATRNNKGWERRIFSSTRRYRRFGGCNV